ncbi:TPA: hypothetical protein HA219_00995 [Candidatus Woesearchaeota archaeon]|nr:hypothetical protein [Candidatus Woesearchaeota archaeon]HIH39286.1 hypothetical protein [Candidatus Woesearchaeota archaeon]
MTTVKEATLERRLEETYLAAQIPEDLKNEVLDYIKNNPSVANKGRAYIKRITKAISKILSHEPDCLDGHIDTAFRYNIEGIKKVKEERSNNTDEHKNYVLTVLESHFNAHAGFAAKIQAGKEKSYETAHAYVADWYSHKKAAAELIEKIRSEEAEMFYLDAYEAAKKGEALAKINHDSDAEKFWLEEKYDVMKKAAVAASGINLISSLRYEYRAGTFAFVMFAKNHNKAYAERAKMHYTRLFDTIRGNDELRKKLSIDLTETIKRFDIVRRTFRDRQKKKLNRYLKGVHITKKSNAFRR